MQDVSASIIEDAVAKTLVIKYSSPEKSCTSIDGKKPILHYSISSPISGTSLGKLSHHYSYFLQPDQPQTNNKRTLLLDKFHQNPIGTHEYASMYKHTTLSVLGNSYVLNLVGDGLAGEITLVINSHSGNLTRISLKKSAN